MADEPGRDSRAVPAVWIGADELPVQFVNQFLGVVAPGEVHLTIGTLVPPPIVGDTVEARRAQVEAIQFLPIRPVARMTLTPAGLQQLIEVLQTTLSNYENQPPAGGLGQ